MHVAFFIISLKHMISDRGIQLIIDQHMQLGKYTWLFIWSVSRDVPQHLPFLHLSYVSHIQILCKKRVWQKQGEHVASSLVIDLGGKSGKGCTYTAAAKSKIALEDAETLKTNSPLHLSELLLNCATQNHEKTLKCLCETLFSHCCKSIGNYGESLIMNLSTFCRNPYKQINWNLVNP